MRDCSIKGCGKPHKALGYCVMHVTRLRRGQPLEGPPKRTNVAPGEARRCRKCGSPGPLVRKAKGSKHEFHLLCIECQNSAYKRRYAVRKGGWLAAKGAKARAQWREDPASGRARVAKYRRELISAALSYLGAVCRECGETDHLVLQIDHIDGGGSAERRGRAEWVGFYTSILRGERDGKLQVLCANCHRIKGWTAPSASYQTAYRRRQRAKVLAHLGGKCRQCAFPDERALEIDHVQGDGAKERTQRRRMGSRYVYKHVLSDTEGRFQLLCANCNWRKRRTTPHERGTVTRPEGTEQSLP